MESTKRKAVVIGAGFAGLETIKHLAKLNMDITLINKTDHFLFQPLLFKVITGHLNFSDIAISINHLFE